MLCLVLILLFTLILLIIKTGVVLVKFINLVIGFDLDVICVDLDVFISVDLDVVIGVDLDVVIGVDHYVQFLFMDKRAMVTPKHCSFSQCWCHCC